MTPCVAARKSQEPVEWKEMRKRRSAQPLAMAKYTTPLTTPLRWRREEGEREREGERSEGEERKKGKAGENEGVQINQLIFS